MKQKEDIIKEFEDIWKHWIYLSEVRTGVNFNAFRDGIKSYHLKALTQARADERNRILRIINTYEHDEEAHSKGRCSYSSLAICSAEEQKIKQILIKKINSYDQ